VDSADNKVAEVYTKEQVRDIRIDLIDEKEVE
jgi:hypothetical protein